MVENREVARAEHQPFGEERTCDAVVDPKRHAVFGHAQCQRCFMFAPYSDGRAEQGAVDFLVVAPGDLPSQCALELTERHRREAPGFVALAGCWIGEGRSWIKMHPPHHRADQALNVAAIMGSAYGPKDQLNALFAARPRKSVAAKISAVVRMHGLRQSGSRPRCVDLALSQPSAFVIHGVQHTEAERDTRRLVHRQMK